MESNSATGSHFSVSNNNINGLDKVATIIINGNTIKQDILKYLIKDVLRRLSSSCISHCIG